MKSNKYYELFIVLLSLYTLIELGVEVSTPLPIKTLKILHTVDLFACIIFLSDFFYFMHKSNKKGKYFITHFIELIASIPFMPGLRIGRIARVFRILRVLRMFKPIKSVLTKTYHNNNINIFYTVLITSCTLLLSFSYFIYILEKGINPSINNLLDAIWWGIATISTVGYGDITPITTAGKLFSIILITLGVTLFSSLTALLSTKFINNNNEFEKLHLSIAELKKEIITLRQENNHEIQ